MFHLQRPITDKKILTSWNALTIIGLSDAYKSTGDKKYIEKAISTINDREKTIIKHRKFREKSITLDELGQMLKISKERVRQIETKALEKLKAAILEISQQNKEFFI